MSHYLINLTWKCQNKCSYCLDGDTLVMKANQEAVPISSLSVGDVVIGVVETGEGAGAYKFAPSMVQGVMTSRKRVYEIEFEDGRAVRCSADHRWFSTRGWKYTTGSHRAPDNRPYLTLKNKIRSVAHHMEQTLPPSREYMRGYLSGMIRGDASLKAYGPYTRKTGQKNIDYHFRLCLSDKEGLERTLSYLRTWGIDAARFTFTPTMQGIRNGRKADFDSISRLIEWNDDTEYRRGFVAGIFDAEGSCQGSVIRITNTDSEILAFTERALQTAGFRTVYDTPKENGVMNLRFRGGRSECVRFFQWCDPAISRKRSIMGQTLKNNVGICAIRDLGYEDTLYDIQTSTGNFIANGLVSHNCWVNQTVKTRPGLVASPERPMADWVAAIQRDAVTVVDIAGGEPLLVPWLADMMKACPETLFGLSTNGLALRGLRRLCQNKPPNLIAVNLSYHPEGPTWHGDYDLRWREAMMMMLDARLPVHTNVVDAPGNREAAAATIDWMERRGIKHEISPYERMDVLAEKIPQGLCCEGGVSHLTIAPDGSAWPCLTTLRSPYWRETCLGNWLDGDMDLSRKPQPCHLNCVDYYVLPQEHSAGDMWNCRVRPCDGGE